MAIAPTITPPLPLGQEWKDVLEELLPPRVRWSEEEYLVLTDHSNRLVEFTDGLPEVLPMPTDKHQSLLRFLFLAFYGFAELRGGTVQFAPLRLHIRPGEFREPDLLIAAFRGRSTAAKSFLAGPGHALEVVTDERPERDLVDKRGDYAQDHVPEYWIVNPQAETVTVLRLHGQAYEEAGVYRRGESATSTLLPGFSVAVAAVFDAK